MIFLISGCNKSEIQDTCNSACLKQGFSEGSCEVLGVKPNPCETELQKTTITSQEGFCPTYKRDGQFVEGIGNICCCS